MNAATLGGSSIPKGLRNKAQGCEERATLGIELASEQTLKGFRHPVSTIKIRVGFRALADWNPPKRQTASTGSQRYGAPSGPEDVCKVQINAALRLRPHAPSIAWLG